MRKEEPHPFSHTKIRTIFKYELQDHNQIYRERSSPSHYPSELHSTAHSNPRLSLPPYFDSDSEPPHPLQPPSRRPPLLAQRSLLPPRPHTRPPAQSKQAIQALSDDHYLQNMLCLKQEPLAKKSRRGKRQKERFKGEKDELDIFLCSEQSSQELIKSNNKRQYTRRQPDMRRKEEDRSEMGRQKLGLASISQQVKKIVADRAGQMTFQQVSDELLRNQILSDNLLDRRRQTSNIRRRVYDALNVLITVNILKKVQRCVVPTESTYIQGKKHSEHWMEINKKKEALRQLNEDYQQKRRIFDLLKEKLTLMLRLHERNRQEQEQEVHMKEPRRGTKRRFEFPLVCWVPKREAGKIMVSIEHEKNERQQDIKKYTILGANQAVQTDIDLLNFITLPKRAEEQVAVKEEQSLEDELFFSEGEGEPH